MVGCFGLSKYSSQQLIKRRLSNPFLFVVFHIFSFLYIGGMTKRVYGLDILRATAILLVVAGHGELLLTRTIFKGFPYILFIDGVDIFFVLSGFLIGTILLNKINKKFSSKELFVFWKMRWFRTLPNYYLFLLINFVLVYWGVIHTNISKDQITYRFLIFMQNFGHGNYGFFWESWSLSVEEWFYFLTPVLLIILLKFFSPKTSFITVAVLMAAFPLCFRIYLYNPHITDFVYDMAFRRDVLSRLDSIAYGLIAAWIMYYYEDFWLRNKRMSVILGVVLFLFLVFFHQSNNTVYKQVFFYSLTPISVLLVFPLFSEIKTGKGRVSKWIVFISKISYSMYLVNFLVQLIISDNFSTPAVLNYFIYWISVITISFFIYKYYEFPIMKLRDRKRKIKTLP